MPELDDIQGLVFSGYRRQPEARYFFLKFEEGEPGPWLSSVLNRITSSAREERGDGPRLNVAFTANGLRALGLPEAALATFPREFLQGMGHAERSRVLGDFGADAPEHWEFGGNQTRFDALVLSYAESDALLEAEAELLEDGFDRFEIEAHDERVYWPSDDREHFGFADARSNPRISGAPRRAGRSFWQRHRYDRSVPLGEFVLGYRNAYRRLASGPRAPILHATRALPPLVDAGRAMDLGRNGSFLALRKLVQDVAGFRRFTQEQGSALWPEAPGNAGIRLGAHLVGRWPNGAPLAHGSAEEPAPGGELQRFGYRERDAKGAGCPLGAHIRRANPRDGLEGSPGQSLLHVRAHRLIRRGRLFGAPLSALAADDGVERGLMFLAIVANLARQFEFVAESWLGNPKYAGLFGERDPLVGGSRPLADGSEPEPFSIQHGPLGLEVPIRRFVRVRGGEYLFMPGLKALAYLAEARA
jgi:deferrochelatase/peroxidase EfeB